MKLKNKLLILILEMILHLISEKLEDLNAVNDNIIDVFAQQPNQPKE